MEEVWENQIRWSVTLDKIQADVGQVIGTHIDIQQLNYSILSNLE